MTWELFLRCLDFVKDEGYFSIILLAFFVTMLETLLIFLNNSYQGLFFLLFKIFFLGENAVAFMLPNRFLYRFEGLITQISFALILYLLMDNWLQLMRIFAGKFPRRQRD